MLTMRKMNPLHVEITSPAVKRAMAQKDAILNKVNMRTSGIHSEIIRARTINDANQKLNEFYTRMSNNYPDIEIKNVTTTQAYAGIVYTVTYKI